jgi:hypothetical protein
MAMTVSKEDDVETKLARLDDHIRKAEQRLDHDRVHGETDIGMTEEQTKKETPDKSAGAV